LGLQALLPSESDTFAAGHHLTIADATAAPIIFRAMLWFKHDYGSYPEGEGLKAHKLLSEDPKFARLRTYYALLKQHPSIQQAILEDEVTQHGASITKFKRAVAASP